MKDEEMAKQFADNISGLDLTCSLLSAKDKSHAYRLGRYDGFLAGLKAGRPQWHKVADRDLPKGYCLVFYKDTSGENSYSIVHPSWYIAGIKAFFENNPRIIAWCEIPTFDKE